MKRLFDVNPPLRSVRRWPVGMWKSVLWISKHGGPRSGRSTVRHFHGRSSSSREPHRSGSRSLASSFSLLFALVIGTRQVPRIV